MRGLALSAPTMPMNGEIEVSATITNRGTRAAEEVVQLYIHDRVASVTRPVRELKAFRKVALGARPVGSRAFHAERGRPRLLRLQDRPVVEPGTFDVWIAPSAQAEGVHGTFDLVA